MSRLPHVSFALLTAVLLAPARATSQPVAPGTVQTLPVITLSINVGSMEKEVRRVVYSPPPGWHIRSHRVECTAKTGLASYTVNTVPADWAWSFDDAATDAAKSNANASAQAHGIGGQAQGMTESRKTTTEHQRTTSSHHALVVDATAHGSGFLGKGAGLELTVYAELVYVGVEKEKVAERPPLLKAVTTIPKATAEPK
jgi:hypothetical protein